MTTSSFENLVVLQLVMEHTLQRKANAQKQLKAFQVQTNFRCLYVCKIDIKYWYISVKRL